MVKEWNDLQVEDVFVYSTPPIEKVQLVKYAGAAGDYHMIHYDETAAKEAGLPGVIVHGMISMGVLGEFVNSLADNKGFVSQIQVRFIEMTFPGEILTCRAKVIRKNELERKAEFEITAETKPGFVVTSGSAQLTYFE